MKDAFDEWFEKLMPDVPDARADRYTYENVKTIARMAWQMSLERVVVAEHGT